MDVLTGLPDKCRAVSFSVTSLGLRSESLSRHTRLNVILKE